MRWKGGRRSTNIEDRRGRSAPRGVIGGGAAILALLAALLFGVDPDVVTDILGDGSAPPQQQPDAPPDEAADFVSVILADTEDTWSALFATEGLDYQEPTLVLYSDAVQSACGISGSATGPFYCPGDQQVYLDLSFFRELERLGASGDFAVAYVIAHEVGHHVQRLLGTEQQVRQLQRRVGEADANALSVLMELQADCYAGMWAHHADRQPNVALEPGDVEEGLNAAAAVGDDRLQRMAGQRVQPESFTHGSSAQRAHWFSEGLQTGRLEACVTFAQARPP